MVFWLCAICFSATWCLYPVAMISFAIFWARANGGSRKPCPTVTNPKVSVILPVYNGEGKILGKLKNLLSLDYPKELLEIIVVSDGSTDRTMEIVSEVKDSRVRALALPTNVGKSMAQNAGVLQAVNEILFFTDLDSSIDPTALEKIVPHFFDSKVGCVGVNVIFRKPSWDTSGSQGTYGRFENLIRVAESRFGVLASLFGSAFAVRKAVFKPLDPDTGDDFIIPLDLALQGYRTVFEPGAIVYDDWSAKSYQSELNVRRRITLRNFTGLLRRKSLLNPRKFPKMAISLMLHKVLRWLSPVLLIVLMLSSIALRNEAPVYTAAFLLQILAYLGALAGGISVMCRKPLPVASTLGSFVVANAGILMGLFSLVKGQRIRGYQNL